MAYSEEESYRAEQKDSVKVKIHLYKNNECDSPDCSCKSETDSANNKVRKAHEIL